MHLDTVNIVDQPQHANAARLRLSAAIGLGLTSIAASILLLTVDGIGGSVHWTHHAGASAAPLLLVAGAIATVSVAHPPNGRHGLMRVVAVLAFAAWGIARLFPDSAASGAQRSGDTAVRHRRRDRRDLGRADAPAGTSPTCCPGGRENTRHGGHRQCGPPWLRVSNDLFSRPGR